MTEIESAEISTFVRAKVKAKPAITARELADHVCRLVQHSMSLRTVYNLLATARSELGLKRPDPAKGARVWLDAETCANLRAAALPGEDLHAVAVRLAASAVW